MEYQVEALRLDARYYYECTSTSVRLSQNVTWKRQLAECTQ